MMDRMESRVEFYYVLLDLHGPEETYRPPYALLKELRAERVEGNFPVWAFGGEADSHRACQRKFYDLLPRAYADRPDVRYGLQFMSAGGYTTYGKYAPVDESGSGR